MKMRRLFVLPIELYQTFLRPLLPPACRFSPSCSEYAREAITTRGILIGGALAARRLLRCHPFNQGGYDPLTRNG